jgi:NAD(P)H-dependent flavin oxidoreductase YrpB (nitropropane dioxygenase family)
MKTPICDLFGIETPIFAFSHCRDVVVEVSKAGGFGVLGASGFSAEQLERELRWIDEHIGGKPYGIDLLMPGSYEQVAPEKKLHPGELRFPERHVAFLDALADEANLPPLRAEQRDEILERELAHINMTPEEGLELFEIALNHPVKLVVSALGPPPRDLVDRAHQRGMKVGALVGSPAHVAIQLERGVDVIVAQGSEAGGHTGSISSMVLWPQVVDAAGSTPVLAAGGIGGGRQIAAALALGAQGAWCGSIWLGTAESELTSELKQRLFETPAEGAVQTRGMTGKPCRVNRSLFTDAWSRPDAPEPLKMPMQSMVTSEFRARAARGGAIAYQSYPVGQIVGAMNQPTSVRSVMRDMLEELAATFERITELGA